MNKIKTTLFAALLTVSAGVFAGNNGKVEADSIVALKHYKFFDNTYVGLYVGDFVTLGENMRPREFFRPSAQRLGGGLTIGKNFSPALGVRMGGYISGLVGVPNREVVMKSRAGGYDGWGFYGYKQVSGYVDVVPNLTNIHYTGSWNSMQWLTSVFGAAFCIFKGEGVTVNKAYYEDPKNLQNEVEKTAKYAKIPADWILDGVELIPNMNSLNMKRIPGFVDAGATSVGATYIGKTVSRKVVSKRADGTPIYQDTNNSTEDFQINDSPMLRRNGEKVPAWSPWK